VPDTRRRLLDGALTTIRTHGVAGASARSIAAAAGVNQALIFYHFGSVDGLVAEACRSASAVRVAQFRDRLTGVRSFGELLATGRELHAEERALGNVRVLAQVLAGAQGDDQLAGTAAASLRLWTAELAPVLDRLLADSPLRDLVDVPALTTAVAAAFIGLELFEAVDPAGATAALDTLGRLAVLVDAVDELDPVARRMLRRKLARSAPAAGRAGRRSAAR
jgi:AcrR family transcriptional regulator